MSFYLPDDEQRGEGRMTVPRNATPLDRLPVGARFQMPALGLTDTECRTVREL